MVHCSFIIFNQDCIDAPWENKSCSSISFIFYSTNCLRVRKCFKILESVSMIFISATLLIEYICGFMLWLIMFPLWFSLCNFRKWHDLMTIGLYYDVVLLSLYMAYCSDASFEAPGNIPCISLLIIHNA